MKPICALTMCKLMLITKLKTFPCECNQRCVLFAVHNCFTAPCLRDRFLFTRHFSRFGRSSQFPRDQRQTMHTTLKNRNISQSLHKQEFIFGGTRCGQSVCSKYAVRGIHIINSKRRRQRIFLKKKKKRQKFTICCRFKEKRVYR
jgi:hypothetical protein